MTTTSHSTAAPQPPTPDPQPPRRGRSTGASTAVIILLTVGALVLVAGIAVAAFLSFQRTPVDLQYTAEAGSSVAVEVPNARLLLTPSDDDQVSVAVSGWHSGPAPEFTVQTGDDVTRVEGDCARAWLARCDITVEVALPASADLAVIGVNGEVSARGIEGSVGIRTTNGGLDIADVGGPIDLRTINGGVRLDGATSDRVTVATTNGNVELRFAQAPDDVQANSTNGSVTVLLPDTEDYRIDARTVNGQVDTQNVATDPDSEHTITVETVNGSVTVENAG